MLLKSNSAIKVAVLIKRKVIVLQLITVAEWLRFRLASTKSAGLDAALLCA